MPSRPSVAVIGGGISGLVAALRLAPHCDVVLVEGAAQLGGKVRSQDFAGAHIDVGAEAFLSRRPEVPALLEELGLSSVAPVIGDPGVLIGSVLKDLPRGTVLGIPTSWSELRRSGVLTTPGLIRAALDKVLAPVELSTDISVGELVRTRLGSEVLERLVDPLLGGVYASSADGLSLEVAAPMIATALRSPQRLMAAAASTTPAGAGSDRPVFGSVVGTMGALPPALKSRLISQGVDLRIGAPVVDVDAHGAGWTIAIGSRASGPSRLEVDAVLLACPATPAAKLLSRVSPTAAGELKQVPYANVAIVSLAYSLSDVPELQRSGYLVPGGEGRWVKAVTMTSEKWGAARYSSPHRLLRASVGRLGEDAALALIDDELIARVVAEIAPVLRAQGSPIEARVTRWGGGLPQYAPGHLGRVARVRSALPKKVRIAGASLDGVGLPACIASADAQAAGLLRDLVHDGKH